LRTDNRKQR